MQIGTETIPVLVMEASLTGQVKDWSSDVSYITIAVYILLNLLSLPIYVSFLLRYTN